MKASLALLFVSLVAGAAPPVSEPRPELTEKLTKLVPPGTFVLSAADAASLAERLGLTPDELLVELIPLARRQARPSRTTASARRRARAVGPFISA